MRCSLQVALLVASVGMMGCYQSHQRERPREADLIDARESDARESDARESDARVPDACRFFYVARTGASVDCTLTASSLTACADAARCICTAITADPSEVEMCIQWETQPRALITFSDSCTPSLPARMSMDQALRSYLESRSEVATISSGCASIPALLP